MKEQHTWTLSGGRQLTLGRGTLVMGILNVTSDSFSDGGIDADLTMSVARALAMADAGAAIIDIGGESTRPGAASVSVEEELARVLPVITALHRARPDLLLSIDTMKSEVAEAAIAAGAAIINDVSAMQADPRMIALAARTRAGCILNHLRGTPQTMQGLAHYQDLLGEVCAELGQAVRSLEDGGVRRSCLVADPGLGFAKNTAHNLELMRSLADFGRRMDLPVLVGASRKRFIGDLLGEPDPRRRDWGTAATVALAAAQGVAIVRVHDVAAMAQVARMSDAILGKADC